MGDLYHIDADGPICDGGAGTISGSRYIESDELFFWTACPVQECRGRSPLPQ